VGVLGARKFPPVPISILSVLEGLLLIDDDRWYPKPITIYYMLGTIGISHNNDGTVPDVITLKVVNEDDKADSGVCELLTGIGGAIAGAVNGVGGSALSLASLACGAI
jgi:hypothetical protein